MTGGVIGISVGGGLILIIAIAACLFWKHSRTRKRDRRRDGATEPRRPPRTETANRKEAQLEEVSHAFQEIDLQWGTTDVQGLSLPGELGGNAIAELPTPESHYYVFHGSRISSAFSASSIRSTFWVRQQSRSGHSNGRTP